ncbi:EFR1 family ferrodoxin [Saccharicrinis sp. FJH2]|uniref:EFR1 family ferrodoxin n=1 Tax=Saccharicrinis sp. FJH65 TaxID=3344659 RepID=UPI0035F4A5C7
MSASPDYKGKRVDLFWFSGTGNAKRVSGWVSDVASQKGFEVIQHNLGSSERHIIPGIEPGSYIGFISPTHGFNYPPLMVKYIFRFPRNPGDCHVFLMNTRAGVMLNRWFLPGVSGIALLLAALVLWLKGYKIAGMRSIDLPSNWISLHPGLREKAILKIHHRCEKKTEDFAHKILKGRKVYRSLLDLPVDLILTPVALAYYFVGRFFIAKTFVATKGCDNCGLCYKNCPVNAIKLVNNRPFWTVKCESCMQCMNACPKRAIETAHGMVVGVITLTNTAVVTLLLGLLQRIGITLPGFITENGTIWFLVLSALYMAVIIFTYRVVHFLQRFKWFDIIIEYTSLTRLKLWNRYQPGKILRKNQF